MATFAGVQDTDLYWMPRRVSVRNEHAASPQQMEETDVAWRTAIATDVARMARMAIRSLSSDLHLPASLSTTLTPS